MVVAFIITLIILNVCRRANPYKADNWFRRLQLVSSGLLSLGHGGNDAQKVMGIIGAAMIWYEKSQGHDMSFTQFIDANMWVPLASFTAIALGTMSGGWKIVRTMGTRITKVTPLEGVSAETAGALTLFLTEKLGDTRQHDAYHYGGDHRGRRNQTAFCGKMGGYDQPALGLDIDHSGQRPAGSIVYFIVNLLRLKWPVRH
jgi:hypothetical protein